MVDLNDGVRVVHHGAVVDLVDDRGGVPSTETLEAVTGMAWGIVVERIPGSTARDRDLALVVQLAGGSAKSVASTRELTAELPDDVDSVLTEEATAAQSELMLGTEFALSFLARRAATSAGAG